MGPTSETPAADEVYKTVKATSAEEIAMMLDGASRVQDVECSSQGRWSAGSLLFHPLPRATDHDVPIAGVAQQDRNPSELGAQRVRPLLPDEVSKLPE